MGLLGQGLAVQQAAVRLETGSAWQRFASLMMGLDALLAVIYMASTVAEGSDLAWVVGALLSMEGALRFRFRGALYTALAVDAGLPADRAGRRLHPGR